MERKVSIFFSKSVIDFLDELLYLLYEKNYFGYKSSASEYVLKIYDFIETSITVFPHKKTPETLNHLGTQYIFYKPNQNTTWFIFLKSKDIHTELQPS